jgi:DNA-binding transcriptional LysR family regulator
MVSLDELRAFVVFSEELNFTRAAAVLHISQPALHTKVNKMAEALGVPLYIRQGRRLELTPAGVEAARFGREMGERSAAFLHEIRGRGTPTVVLAAGEGSYLYLLDEGIRRFHALSVAPLRLLTRDWSGVIAAVRSGVAHVGVVPLDAPLDGLERQPLADVAQVLLVPRTHSLARSRQVRLRDLAGQRLIVAPADRPQRIALGRALQSADVEWEPAVEATGWPLMMHFAVLGLGLAVVNGFCRPPAGLVARPLPDLPRIRYFLVWRAGVPSSSAVQTLRSTLLRSLESPAKVKR